MFGNIKPYKPEMKMRDFTNYRAYYCGLCKSMGSRYAGLCNLGLSYEAVFIALIMSSLSDDKVTVKMKNCFMHPFSKRAMVIHNASVDKAAALNVLLMYNSFCDNVKDENDFKSRLAKLWFKGPYRKAVEDNREEDKLIKESLDELHLIEESCCDMIERVAQPFADMMGQIASRLVKDGGKSLYDFGFFMGKWLYVIDAYADIEHDIKHKSYNPFILAYPENTKQNSKNDAEYLLSWTLEELGNIYDTLEIKRNKEIIENILFFGMPHRTHEVLEGKDRINNKNEFEMI